MTGAMDVSHMKSRAAGILRVSAAIALLALGSAPVFAQTHPNLSGLWEPRAGSMKRIGTPALTPAGQALLAETVKANANPNGVGESSRYCLAVQQPWYLVQSPPIDIVQNDREMSAIFEGTSVPWHVYSDGRGHRQGAAPTLNGDSIGRWEGEEFVVDTINFAERPGHGPINGLPLSSTLHVVERFKLAAGGAELHAHFVIEDPRYLAKPYEYDFTWYRDPPEAYAAMEVCDARNPAMSHY